MEGVMMRGKCSMATAVRDPQGEIQIESERLTPPEKQKKFLRLPFVRGVVNFISSLTDGNRILLRSAEVQEEDPKDDETAVKPDKKGDGFMGTIATIIGVVLALGLFIVLPSFLTGLLPKNISIRQAAAGRACISTSSRAEYACSYSWRIFCSFR